MSCVTPPNSLSRRRWMAVAAHDEEADAVIADLGEQDIARVDAEGGLRVPSLRPDSMVRQMRADVGAGYMPAVGPVDAEDDYGHGRAEAGMYTAAGGRRSGRLSCNRRQAVICRALSSSSLSDMVRWERRRKAGAIKVVVSTPPARPVRRGREPGRTPGRRARSARRRSTWSRTRRAGAPGSGGPPRPAPPPRRRGGPEP